MLNAIRSKIPAIGTLLAWVGIISTITGLISFFVLDLPSLFKDEPEVLSQQDIVATLASLQDDKERAELQLTEIALAEQSVANASTQQAIDEQQAQFQSTVNAIGTEQAAFVATQNAVAAASATAQAEIAFATATQDAINLSATESAQNATATANFLAQITPTPTPLPTTTPTPIPAADHRTIDMGMVILDGSEIVFSLEVVRPVPNKPTDGLSYSWMLETDSDDETGLLVRERGIDILVALTYTEETWVGTIEKVLPDGTLSEPQYFVDFSFTGAKIEAVIDAELYGMPTVFDWFAVATINEAIYSSYPEQEFLSVP